MRVRNKRTGLIWEVEGEHLKRLSKNPDYEILELKEYNIKELRGMAANKGIERYKELNKSELIEALEV